MAKTYKKYITVNVRENDDTKSVVYSELVKLESLTDPAKYNTFVGKSTNFTFDMAESGFIIGISTSTTADVTMTLPEFEAMGNRYPKARVLNMSTKKVTFVAGANVTIHVQPTKKASSLGKGSVVEVMALSTNEWLIRGDLETA